MAGNGNEFLPNYVEHLVPLQENRLILPRKLGLIALAVALVLGLGVAVITTPFLQYFGGGIFLLLLGIMILIWYLSRFAAVEFEYTVLGGEINFEIIYGRRQRKKYYSAKINRFEILAPVAGKALKKDDFQGVTREVFCAAKMDNPRTWYAIVNEENGEQTLLFFAVTDKAEKVLRFHNSRAMQG